MEILIIFSRESIFSIDKSVDISSDIHSAAISTTQKIDINKKMYGDLITGITLFGFNLKKYEKYEDLGRYMGDIQFEVVNSRLENNTILFDANLNLQSERIPLISV